jgi:hypothetical protein
MTEFADKTFERRGEWTLSKDALERLLNWLEDGANSDGRAYVEMRRRLRDYFGRKNCRTPDDLADETLTRVARRLEEEGITRGDTPARYCYIVARFVFLEHLRETKAHPVVTHAWLSREVSPGARSAESSHHHALLHRKRASEDRQPPRAGRKPRPQPECPDSPGVQDPYTAGSVCPALRGRRMKGFQQGDLSYKGPMSGCDRRSPYRIRA